MNLADIEAARRAFANAPDRVVAPVYHAVQPAALIFSDGGCKPNPGRGGWAAVVLMGSERIEVAGFELRTTNNRMELTAAIRGLEVLRAPTEVRVYSDSSYLVNGMNCWLRSWARRRWCGVKNGDLWRRLARLNEHHSVQWFWIPGHAGHAENVRADTLVRQQLRRGPARLRGISAMSRPAPVVSSGGATP